METVQVAVTEEDKMKFTLVFIFSFLIISVAQASDKLLSAPDICKGTQTDLNTCSFDYFKKADADLNKFYQLAINRLDGNDKKFRENQRTWIKYRDQTCEFTTREDENGGTIWPLIHSMCMINLTVHRTEMIKGSFMEALDF